MTESDLAMVRSITNGAFRQVREALTGRRVEGPAFPDPLYPYRLAADPGGCFVATLDGSVVGAVFSVSRGPMGWFGPLATDVERHGRGIGQSLVHVCVERWQYQGVRLMGLETFAASDFHIYLYAKFGFRPAWTGIAFSKTLTGAAWPDAVRIGGSMPDLEFVYPGLSLSSEADATLRCQVGEILTIDGGMAIIHLKDTFAGTASTTFLMFLAAPDRTAFDTLLRAAEFRSIEAGNRTIFVRAPGSCWATYEALTQAGYRPGRVMVRMKRGEKTDYDHAALYYCDSWL